MELPAYHEELLGEDNNDRIQREIRWGHPSNLDVFFTDMYTYKYQQGLAAIIVTQICSMVTLGFTVAFSSFLLVFVDWNSMMSCNSEDTCQPFDAYVIKNPFVRSSFSSFLSFLYMILFGVFWVWKFFLSVQCIFRGIEMERFYREVLEIHDVQDASWNEVLYKLIQLHELRY